MDRNAGSSGFHPKLVTSGFGDWPYTIDGSEILFGLHYNIARLLGLQSDSDIMTDCLASL